MLKQTSITVEDLERALSGYWSKQDADRILRQVHDFLLEEHEKSLLEEMHQIVAELPKLSFKEQKWWDLQQRFDKINGELGELMK